MIGWINFTRNLRAASARIRGANIVAHLSSQGYPIEIFDERNQREYRIVVFSKCYDHRALKLTRSLKDKGVKVIFDMCDNHFYNPYGLKWLEEAKQRIITMVGMADEIVASTLELARAIRFHTSTDKNITVIGDAVEDGFVAEAGLGMRKIFPLARLEFIKMYRLRKSRHQRKIRLLWCGTHGVTYAPCGMLDILKIQHALIEINKRHPISLTVISNNWRKYMRYIKPVKIETFYFEWDPSTFYELLEPHDICIIPISVNPFTVCKTNNRLVQALYRGLPTVADAIPSYLDLGPFCFLDSWEEGLMTYITHPEVGYHQVQQARAYIEKKYSIKPIAEAWRSLFERICSDRIPETSKDVSL